MDRPLRSRLVLVEYYVLIWMVKLTTIMADMVSIPVTIPTGETRRTRAIPTTRGTWDQMVPLVSSTTMSAIPTEYYDRLWMETIIFIQKHWWLRSPYMVYYNGACHVRSDGAVGYSNYNHTSISYGSISPGTEYVFTYFSF